MALRSSSSVNSGSGFTNTLTVSAPSGVAQNDIVILAWQNGASATSTVTWPSGFTELVNASGTTAGTTYRIAWKREGASPPSSYTVSSSTTDYCVLIAAAYANRSTTAAPTYQLTVQSTGQVSPISINAGGVTAAAGDDIGWFVGVTASGGSSLSASAFTAPTNYTLRQDSHCAAYHTSGFASRDNVSAGATGTLTGGWSYSSVNSNYWQAVVIAIPAGPWTTSKGFNFRATSGIVTDGTGQTYVTGDMYPTTRMINGESVTFGWETTTNHGDRSIYAPYTPEMSGLAFNDAGAGTERVFRIDLPTTGNFQIQVGAVDAGNPNQGYFGLRDNTTEFKSVGNTSLTGTQTIDANGTVHADIPTWRSSATAVDQAFASTIFRFALKGSATNSSIVNHISIRPYAGAGTARTTAAAGNWNNTATWTGGVVPVPGDTVTLNHNVTVNTAVDIGSSPLFGGTPAIKWGVDSVVLTIAANLTLRGDLVATSNGSTQALVVQQAGTTVTLDSSNAFSPDQSAPRIAVGTFNKDWCWQATGAFGNPCVVQSATNGGRGYFAFATIGGVSMDCKFTKFYRIGGPGDAGFHSQYARLDYGSNARQLFRFCVFDSCGHLYIGNTSSTSQLLFSQNVFKNSVGTKSGSYGSRIVNLVLVYMQSATVKVVENNFFDGELALQVADSITCHDNYMFNHWSDGNPFARFTDNVISTDSNTFIWSGVGERCYLLHPVTTEFNPHVLGFAAKGTDGCKDSVFECSFTSTGGGDLLMYGQPATLLPVAVTGNIVIPNPGGQAPGKFVSILNNNTNEFMTADHNTIVSDWTLSYEVGVVQCGEGGYGAAGAVASVRSNLAWSPTNAGAAILTRIQSGSTNQDVVSAVNVSHNATWNPVVGTDGVGYVGNNALSLFTTGIPGAQDRRVYADPFVDRTRNMQKWAVSLGKAQTNAAAIDAMRLRLDWSDANYAPDNRAYPSMLVEWVRNGFRTTDPVLRRAGHDGKTIGAMPMDDETVRLDAVTEYNIPWYGVTSVTFNHTVGNGPNRYLLVGIVRGTGWGVPVGWSTFNSAGLTNLGSQNNGSWGNEVFFLGIKDPTPGNGTLTINFNTQTRGMIFVASFFNVDQDNPVGPVVTNTGSETVVYGDVGDVIIDLMASAQTTVTTPRPSNSIRLAQRHDFSGSGHTAGMTMKYGTGNALSSSWSDVVSISQITAALRVAKPRFLAQPANKTVSVGATAAFTATATGRLLCGWDGWRIQDVQYGSVQSNARQAVYKLTGYDAHAARATHVHIGLGGNGAGNVKVVVYNAAGAKVGETAAYPCPTADGVYAIPLQTPILLSRQTYKLVVTNDTGYLPVLHQYADSNACGQIEPANFNFATPPSTLPAYDYPNGMEFVVFLSGPAGTVADNFRRADENPLNGSGKWTQFRAWPMRITSQVVKGSPSGGSMISAGYRKFGAIQSAEIEVGAIGSFDVIGPTVLCNPSSNGQGYALYYYSAGNAFITKNTSGGYGDVQIAIIPGQTVAAGDRLRLLADATNPAAVRLYAYKNDVLIATAVDSSSPLTSGQPGMFYQYENVAASSIKSFVALDYLPSVTWLKAK